MYSLLALLSVFAGLVVFLQGILQTKKLLLAIPLALDFFTAAGLLKLSGSDSWKTIAGAATIVVIRKLVGLTLRSAA